MIRQIKRIGAASKAVARALFPKKKTKDLMTYIGLGAAGSSALLSGAKIVSTPVRDEFVYTIPKVSKKTLAKDTIRLSKSLTYKFDLPHLEKNKTFLEIVSPTSKQPMNFLDCQKKVVFSIIEEDKNCPKDIDKEKLAEKILSIALDYGVDPIDIACIVKRESHFHTNAVGGNARGLMQITPIVVKDMFQPGRSELYHEKLKTLKRTYGTKESLLSVLNRDTVNLRVGTLSYHLRLKEAKGNTYNALKNYNGSSKKESYATAVLKEIKKYKKRLEDLQKEQ